MTLKRLHLLLETTLKKVLTQTLLNWCKHALRIISPKKNNKKVIQLVIFQVWQFNIIYTSRHKWWQEIVNKNLGNKPEILQQIPAETPNQKNSYIATFLNENFNDGRHGLLCLVTQTFCCSPAAKQILPLHHKTMALSTNEQHICRLLLRTKPQSTYLFTVLPGNQTSQRRCSETDYDKGSPSTIEIDKYSCFYEWL